MKIAFEKYHGSGNDFIIFDDRKSEFKPSKNLVESLCHRRFGIGADGLILLQESKKQDFKMTYFNADGFEGSMCGNGGRCIIFFALQHGLIDTKADFETIDGEHVGKILSGNLNGGIVSLKMADVKGIKRYDDGYFSDTGSPHFVKLVENMDSFDAYEAGKQIRWDSRFRPKGTNVDFVVVKSDHLFVRTFERGVEDLTLSCGTGVVAAAIVAAERSANRVESYPIKTDGGDLLVRFKKYGHTYTDIWLEGPVAKVYEGAIDIET